MANVAAGRQVLRCTRWEHSTGWTEDDALQGLGKGGERAGYEDIAGQYSIIDVKTKTPHALSFIFVGPASVMPVAVPFPLLDAASEDLQDPQISTPHGPDPFSLHHSIAVPCYLCIQPNPATITQFRLIFVLLATRHLAPFTFAHPFCM
ncbi:unnamed protein product [Clonostachys byssicola]|uniref:Uncharacterized protein n=1 Tax=Clonostachys byssicola TaxID=160290 RepID=A0A9N9UR00_9HYPO|nr:unnamed protein product [Clonostachys byssicola]